VAESRQKRVTREAQVSDPQSQSSSSNQPQTLPPAMLHQPNPTVPNVEMIHAPSDYPYFLDPIHAMAPGSGGVSHAWNDPSTTHSIEPSQMHVVAPQVVSRAPYQHDWSNYEHPSHLNAPAEYDYQYRTNWQYYGPSVRKFAHSFDIFINPYLSLVSILRAIRSIRIPGAYPGTHVCAARNAACVS